MDLWEGFSVLGKGSYGDVFFILKECSYLFVAEIVALDWILRISRLISV